MSAATTVGAFDAKTHLSALLERAAAGETITVTKHGTPIAQIVPLPAKRAMPNEDVDVFEKFRRLREEIASRPGYVPDTRSWEEKKAEMREGLA